MLTGPIGIAAGTAGGYAIATVGYGSALTQASVGMYRLYEATRHLISAIKDEKYIAEENKYIQKADEISSYISITYAVAASGLPTNNNISKPNNTKTYENYSFKQLKDLANKNKTKLYYTKKEFEKLKTSNNSRIKEIVSKNPIIEARTTFVNHVKPETIVEVKPGVFVAKGYNDATYTLRAVSGSGEPTINIKGGVEFDSKNTYKIKFKDK